MPRISAIFHSRIPYRGRAAAWALAGALVACLAFGLPVPAAEQTATLRVGGTGASLGLMQLLGEEFSRQHPAVRVQVEPSLGSSGAIAAVAARAIDLGVSSRPVTREESARGLRHVEFARTAFVFAVHRDVPISRVSLSELAAIYAGTVTSWPDGSPIRLILRPEREFDTNLMRSMSPELERAVRAAQTRAGLQVAVSDQDSVVALEQVPGSIGTSSLALIASERRKVRVLAVEGVAPSVQALETGAYRYARPFYLISSASASATTQAFAEFAASPGAREVLLRYGALPWLPAR
ncbi:MAG TPA: substrate-binding domain-containing protein [Burkholderiales bacterium]|nr:substrate-binding domain-containing protein [Burkholderiales bacterium]